MFCIKLPTQFEIFPRFWNSSMTSDQFSKVLEIYFLPRKTRIASPRSMSKLPKGKRGSQRRGLRQFSFCDFRCKRCSSFFLNKFPVGEGRCTISGQSDVFLKENILFWIFYINIPLCHFFQHSVHLNYPLITRDYFCQNFFKESLTNSVVINVPSLPDADGFDVMKMEWGEILITLWKWNY